MHTLQGWSTSCIYFRRGHLDTYIGGHPNACITGVILMHLFGDRDPDAYILESGYPDPYITGFIPMHTLQVVIVMHTLG